MARKPKEKGPSFGQRVGENINALGELGRTAVNEPGNLPRRAEGMFRRWFRKVWEVRGGGLYATGFAAFFIYFEVTEFISSDIPQIFSTNLASSEVIGLIIDFIIDTFMNFVAALIWPVHMIAFAPPWGAVALGILFLFFDQYLRPHIEAWMAKDDGVAKAPVKET